MSGSVTTIKIDNAPLNTLTREVRLKLKSAIQNAIDNPVCKIIMLVGAGSAFSVGADIKELATPWPLGAEGDAMAAYVSAYNTHNVSYGLVTTDPSSLSQNRFPQIEINRLHHISQLMVSNNLLKHYSASTFGLHDR